MSSNHLVFLVFCMLAISACTAGNGSDAPQTGEFVPCEDPRPEACTLQYDPVCAQVDTGIRCITEPCPSTEERTYGNGCTACGDPDVMGYTPGECASDTEAPAEQFMICKGDGWDRTEFAEIGGFACVDECPEGMDEYSSQIGPLCVRHIGETEMASWATCGASSDGCQCAYASRTTDGKEVSWPSDAEGFRCIPPEYAGVIINTGMRSLDENGEESVMIA